MKINLTEFLESASIISQTDGTFSVGWGQCTKSKLGELRQDLPAFYTNDFFLKNNTPWTQYKNNICIDHTELTSLLMNAENLFPVKWEIGGLTIFQSKFNELISKISEKHLEKAVPYIFTHSSDTMSSSRLINCIKTALKKFQPHQSFLYGCWNSTHGFLGVSPEILFSHSLAFPQTVHTCAVAGTSSQTEANHSFLNNEKETHEHALVIKGIRHCLQDLGTFTAGETQILNLKGLSHLKTPLSIELNQSFNFNTLLERLHPTPALGAYPKLAGHQWLNDYNCHFPRMNYGAPFGFRDSHNKISRCIVAIRNVQWDPQGMKIGAGCGVVKESEFESEWKEIQLKIASVKDMLNL